VFFFDATNSGRTAADAIKYTGGRTEQAITSWVNKRIKEKPLEPEAAVEVDDEDFEKIV